MFARLFRRDRQNEAIAASLYGAIVAQARQPALYRGFGVADTIDGRFEMLVLHLFLVLERLSRGSEAERGLAQAVFDLHVSQMDGSLRELGIGDMTVPRRMRAMAEAFYGRSSAYREALGAPDPALLAAALARNVFAGIEAPRDAAPLAAYVRAAADALATAASFDRPPFPDPAAFVAHAEAS
jgi:cytochrome b pre-mRNA-processing protein 3